MSRKSCPVLWSEFLTGQDLLDIQYTSSFVIKLDTLFLIYHEHYGVLDVVERVEEINPTGLYAMFRLCMYLVPLVTLGR